MSFFKFIKILIYVLYFLILVNFVLRHDTLYFNDVGCSLLQIYSEIVSTFSSQQSAIIVSNLSLINPVQNKLIGLNHKSPFFLMFVFTFKSIFNTDNRRRQNDDFNIENNKLYKVEVSKTNPTHGSPASDPHPTCSYPYPTCSDPHPTCSDPTQLGFSTDLFLYVINPTQFYPSILEHSSICY